MKKYSPQRRECAEIGEFFNQELFTPRPPRLRGAISESYFTGMPEVPAKKTFLLVRFPSAFFAAHRFLLTTHRHLMTLSALAKTLGGMVNPICLAALRLMMNSNFVGCSTGSSAGLAPLRILSTYTAARRYRSTKLTP